MQHRPTTEAIDALRQQTVDTIDRVGWQAVGVFASETTPTFTYTVGLTHSYDHPEIILFGIDIKNAQAILVDVVDMIKRGKSIVEGRRYSKFVRKFDVIFREASPERIDGYLNAAIWYYGGRDFRALQMFWPDQAGCFPWDPAYNQRFSSIQPVLFDVIN